MLFRQIQEPESSTYTYLLSCPASGKTALIDPVLDTIERDLKTLQDMGLELDYAVETHIHADHLTSGLKLREHTGCQVVGPALDELPCRDIGLREGEPFRIGNIELHPLFTPGHTETHHAYLMDNGAQQMLFSGDALMIEACGRTDFQGGDSAALYQSVQHKFFTLPDETLVYPAHDYHQRRISTIGQEKLRNPRLGGDQTLEGFVALMNDLDLPYPKKIDYAVPGNELCGECPDNVPDEMYRLCDISIQG